MTTEYRVTIQVPRLPVDQPDRWEPIIDHLERQSEDMGPVLSWDDPTTARFTLALFATIPQAAEKIAHDTLITAILRAGRPYPGRPKIVDVQPIDVEAEDEQLRHITHRAKRD